VGVHFDIADLLIRLGVDDSDLAVVLPGILSAVSDVEKLGVGIKNDSVGTEVQLASSRSRVSPRNTRSIPSSPLATNTLLRERT
jgi:hypothetical protein